MQSFLLTTFFSPWLEVNLYFSSGLCSPFQNTGWLLSQFFSLFHQIVHFFPPSACNSLGFQILMCRKGKGKLHLACLNFYYNSLKLLLKWTAIKTCYNFGKLCLFLSFVLALAALEMCYLVVCSNRGNACHNIFKKWYNLDLKPLSLMWKVMGSEPLWTNVQF